MSERPVVLIVDREPATRDRVGGWLEDAGLEVVVCPGPTAPEFTCVGSRDGRCPLAQEADVIVLDLWLESDAAMRGTRAGNLFNYYRSWGKPVVVMTDRHDDATEWVEDLSVPTVDWPPDRRELVETIRVLSNSWVDGDAITTHANGALEISVAPKPSPARERRRHSTGEGSGR